MISFVAIALLCFEFYGTSLLCLALLVSPTFSIVFLFALFYITGIFVVLPYAYPSIALTACPSRTGLVFSIIFLSLFLSFCL
ncbi:hypothetical protein HOY82DRAFT_556643, partial [Tuber indicum]